MLIECLFSMSTGTMSSFPRTNFLETDAMFLEFEDNLDNLAGGSSSVDDNASESKNFLHFNCVIIDLLSRIFFSTTCDSDFQETCVVSTLGVRAPRCNKWTHSDDDRPWSGEAYFSTRRSLQPNDRRVRAKDISRPLS